MYVKASRNAVNGNSGLKTNLLFHAKSPGDLVKYNSHTLNTSYANNL